MPTNRKRTTRTRTGGAAEIAAAVDYFDRGYLIRGVKYWGTGKTEGEIRDFWAANRDAIMAASLEKHKAAGRPFRRPFPFWDWDKRPPRLKVGRERWLGPLKGPEPRRWHTETVYESDDDYLARNGLLEDWEILKKEKKEV